MTTSILTPVYLVPGTSLADLGVNVVASTMEKRTVRVVNVGSVQGKADLVLTDGSTVIYLAKDLLITVGDDGSVVDLVVDQYVPPGWKYRCKSDVVATLGFSITGLKLA